LILLGFPGLQLSRPRNLRECRGVRTGPRARRLPRPPRRAALPPYRQGQEEQLNALGLIVNTIVLYNTIYTQRALDHIAASTGAEPREEDIERLSPLGSDHITLTGRYRILLPAPLHDRGAYRALNTTGEAAAA
jgi:Tn3 transposase DDE domain